MKPTPINRSPINDRALVDLQKMITMHPNAFECLVFKPKLDEPEIINHETDVVGTLEARETTFSYSSPSLTKALELPSELSSVMLAAGIGTDDAGETPRQFLLQEQAVPEQSVIWIDELVNNEIRTTLLYVLSAESIGKNGTAGFKYNLIPFELDAEALTDDVNEFAPPAQPDTTGEPILGSIESVFSGFNVT